MSEFFSKASEKEESWASSTSSEGQTALWEYFAKC